MRRNLINIGLYVLPCIVAIYTSSVVHNDSITDIRDNTSAPPLSPPSGEAHLNTIHWKSSYVGYLILASAFLGISYYLCTKGTTRPPVRQATGPLAKTVFSIREQLARLTEKNEYLEKKLALFTEQNRIAIFSALDRDIRYEPTDSTPEEFICPITKEIIRHPVKLERQFYERSALEIWYTRGNQTSPLTRRPMPDPSTLLIDTALRNKIAAYILNSKAVSLRHSRA